jgi:predicted nucleotidyltransferase
MNLYFRIMNLTDPSSAITSSLDGPVLVALANAGKSLTVPEVASLSVRGSEIGIRKSLGRLVNQGIVIATDVGSSRAFQLNREHVAADIAIRMAALRSDLWRLIARDIERWKYPPLYASIFGSAARHDGDSESDIDLLLVRPSTHSEISEKQRNNPVLAGIEFGVTALTSRILLESQLDVWEKSIDKLRGRVRLWSGNPLQVVDISSTVWAEHRHNKTEIYNNIKIDEVRLYDELGATLYRFPKERSSS